MKIPNAKYVAIPSWDGQQWRIRIEDYDGVHRGETTAVRLEQVARAASRWLNASFGIYQYPFEVSVEPRLPEQVDGALEVADAHVAKATREVEAVVTGLRQAHMSGQDIAALLAERALTAAPRQPLLISNSEIASYGLGLHPEVLAVEWVDGDTVLTCCRACVEGRIRAWQDPPHRFSAAIYDGPDQCDFCGADITQLSRARGEAKR